MGIDLGTTSSSIAIWKDENVVVIPDEYGNKFIPSCVAFTNVNRYIGFDAKNQREINPKNMFYEIKRLIGRKIDDPLLLCEKEFISYNIVPDEHGNILLQSEIGKKFTPEEIQSTILIKLKQLANDYLKTDITKAIITIPAYFNDGQRQATKDASEIAGFKWVRFINEPTAAGIAYGLYNRTVSLKTKKTVMVYDFGGGTLDITIMEIDNGIFEVICSSGNTRLGGSDFDNRLMSFSMSKFKKVNKLQDLVNLPCLSLQKLRTTCEQAKKILSTNTKALIMVKEFYNNKDLVITLKREDFEKLCGDLLMLSLKPIDDILKSSKLSTDDIDDVILVGGMTRVPIIRQLIKTKFNKEPNCSINPEEAVVIGASIQGFMLSNNTTNPFSDSIQLVDTLSLSLGIETIGGIMDVIIPRNTIFPVKYTKTYTTCDDFVDCVTIKIYEGERTLTKDNFFVGAFDLMGIEKNPRGFAEIDITFSVDENTIISVEAEYRDKNGKVENNKINSIIVNSNKNRLSREDIDRLIEEAKEEQLKDELEKMLKILHYQIDDYCSNILVNLKRDEFKITLEEKQKIEIDVNSFVAWLNEKKYNEREIDDYKNKLNLLKNKYGVLILKGSLKSTDKIKAIDTQTNGINIYTDDEQDEDTKKLIEIEENKGMEDPDATEIKELKTTINELCYSINDIIHSPTFNVADNDKTILMNYIDDTLLWINIHQNITKIDLKIKLDEINENCDKVMNEYKDKKIFSDIIENKMQELEELCLSIQLLNISLTFTTSKKLHDIITDTLHSIYTEQFDINQCQSKIDEINSLSNEVYQTIQYNIKPETTKQDVKDNIGVVEIKEDKHEQFGTDILTIMKNRQARIIEDIINQQD